MKGVIVGLGKVGLSVSHYFAERFDLAGIDISPVEEFPGDLLRLDITDDSPAATQALEGVLRGSDFILYTNSYFESSLFSTNRRYLPLVPSLKT